MELQERQQKGEMATEVSRPPTDALTLRIDGRRLLRPRVAQLTYLDGILKEASSAHASGKGPDNRYALRPWAWMAWIG